MSKESANNKKTVTYDIERGVLQHPSGGVILWPIDHPDTEWVSSDSYSLTSKVMEFDFDSNIIETLNTIYKPNKNI